MTRARKVPTLAERAARVAYVYAGRAPDSVQARCVADILRALRAAVRAERAACEQECRDVAAEALVSSSDRAIYANECADRIRRRPRS